MKHQSSGKATNSTGRAMKAYFRNVKAIGVLWAIFTLCYAVIALLVFFQPYWLGNSSSDHAGVFGLYQYCTYAGAADLKVETCQGDLTDFNGILSPFFKASTISVGLSALFILLCIVFICLLIGCAIFPAGWDQRAVKNICGPDAAMYNKGVCDIRWSYILAIVGIFDVLFLSFLGFTLAFTPMKTTVPNAAEPMASADVAVPGQLQLMPAYRVAPATATAIVPRDAFHGHNGTMGTVERMSHSSGTTLKPTNRARAEYAVAMQNFQL